MPNKYQNLWNNIQDISKNCSSFGDYYNLLGRNRGYCFGLVFMWGQAVLAEEEDVFFRRLDILTQEYVDYPGCRLSDMINLLISYRKGREEPPNYVLNPDIIESIHAFLDGLLIYHYPNKTSLYKDKVDTSLFTQDGVASSNYPANAAIYQASSPDDDGIPLSPSLIKIYSKPFVGNQGDYNTIIPSVLRTAILLHQPFFIHLDSGNHAIGLTYSHGKINLYNANCMQYNKYFYTIDEIRFISKFLFQAFPSELIPVTSTSNLFTYH